MKKKKPQPEPLKYFMIDKVCAQCGKAFCVKDQEEYVYKNCLGGTKYNFMRSWHCYRDYQREHEHRGGGRVTEVEKRKIFSLIDRGWSDEAIAETIGVTRNAVGYWRRRERMAGG